MTGDVMARRLSSFELAYLLTGRADLPAVTARGLLGLPPASEAAVWEQAGRASLELRGLVDPDQEHVLPRNWVGGVGQTVGAAANWIIVHTKDPEWDEVSVFVQGPRAAMLLVRDRPAVWAFTGVEVGDSLVDLATRVVAGYLDDRPAGVALVRSVDPLAEDVRSVFAKRDGEAWLLGRDPVFPGDTGWPAPDLELEDLGRDAMLAAVAGKLAPHRVPIE